ncbi:UNVERIFIED_CONTAM: hypothetical protein GTU68_046237 [Idotea baltica]|nr:hypothetical protein [Idotea baltica]
MTAGGIVLPDAAQNKPQQGEVIAVGDGHVNNQGEKVALTVKEGDEITIGDDEYLLLRESDIMATL